MAIGQPANNNNAHAISLKQRKIRENHVSTWSASYSLEKNSVSGGGITNFTNQARICTDIMNIISRLIGLISRLGLGLIDSYFGIVD